MSTCPAHAGHGQGLSEQRIDSTGIKLSVQIGGRYTAGCVTLDCMGYSRNGKLFNEQAKAIEAWNRRADDE